MGVLPKQEIDLYNLDYNQPSFCLPQLKQLSLSNSTSKSACEQHYLVDNGLLIFEVLDTSHTVGMIYRIKISFK